jgi:curli biogenesis system outer membrane secretion channel CsgG
MSHFTFSRTFARRLPVIAAALTLVAFATPLHALELAPVMAPFQALTESSTQQYTLAIMPLQGESETKTAVDTYIEGSLLQAFSQISAFQVLERAQIQQLLKEQGFSQTAYVSPEAALQVGQMLGARLIITGHYVTLPTALQLHLRLVDAESGRILKVIQEDIPKDQNLYALLGQLTPEQKQAQEQKATQDQLLNTAINVTGALAKAYLDNQFPRQGLNLQPESPPPPALPPFNPPVSSPQRLYAQDFSGFAPGTPLPHWGAGMVVRKSNRYPMHVLTTENPSTQQWSQLLTLPEDFVLEIHAFDQTPGGMSMSPLTLKLWSQDRSRNLLIHKQGHGFAAGNSPLQSAPWRAQDWNIIALKKVGTQITCLVNGQVVFSHPLSGQYWSGLEVQSPVMNRWAFTRLSVFLP